MRAEYPNQLDYSGWKKGKLDTSHDTSRSNTGDVGFIKGEMFIFNRVFGYMATEMPNL